MGASRTVGRIISENHLHFYAPLAMESYAGVFIFILRICFLNRSNSAAAFTVSAPLSLCADGYSLDSFAGGSRLRQCYRQDAIFKRGIRPIGFHLRGEIKASLKGAIGTL
jgi:hypothetical protein